VLLCAELPLLERWGTSVLFRTVPDRSRDTLDWCTGCAVLYRTVPLAQSSRALVVTRPDPPTQEAHLEDLGLSDPITEPDPDLCVETEHRLPIPARPVYELYQYVGPFPEIPDCNIVTRVMHNTLTDRVAMWNYFDKHPRNLADKLVIVSATDDVISQILIPQFRWHTHTPRQYGKLLELLRR
jgi:hypothetical protein